MRWDRLARGAVCLGLALEFGLLTPGTARAGVPECGDIRLEDVDSCEVRGSFQCSAGCDKLGVYKKACATKLQKVCRKDCVLSGEPACEDECTGKCKSECDRGLNITCAHNCFRECEGSCEASCTDAADPARCVASCEATCDGECDVQCGAVVDASCYEHCIECCGGSCTAQANMTCQTTCQDEEFETCEYELKADCSASCTGSGALFCDDEFVLSAEDAAPCVHALALRGIADVELDGSVDVGGSIDPNGLKGNGKSAASAGCALANGPQSSWGLGATLLALVLGARRRRMNRSL